MKNSLGGFPRYRPEVTGKELFWGGDREGAPTLKFCR